MKQYLLMENLDLVCLGDFDHINNINAVDEAAKAYKAEHGPVLVYLDETTAENWKNFVRRYDDTKAYFVVEMEDFGLIYIGQYPDEETARKTAETRAEWVEIGYRLVPMEAARRWLQ